jgi:hypothetical protein
MFPSGAVLAALLAISSTAYGGATSPVPPTGAIPRQFTSGIKVRTWSLFLVCNPVWLQKQKSADLRSLYSLYQAFGKTTGDQHAAVWFVSRDQNLDNVRETRYCERFELAPSEGPHIVVTTVHPDDWKPGDSRVQISLGNRTAVEAAKLINVMNDQILGNKLSQQGLDKREYWLTWGRVASGVCTYLGKVTFKVDAKAAGVEIKGLC